MKNVLFLSDYEDEIEYQAVFEKLSAWDIIGITAKPREISVINTLSGTEFFFRGETLRPDLVVGYAYEDDLLAAVKLMKLWQMSGVAVLNHGSTLFCGQNKDLSSAMLNAAEGVRHLPYFKFPSLPAEEEMESIGFPLVAKPVNGACGRGLFKLNSYQELSAWVRQNERYLDDYYVQPYIPKLNNEDYRVVVVNHVACYAYSRRGANGSWITNLMKEGTGKTFTVDALPENLIAMAEKSSRAANSLFCGVDVALDETGIPFIIEINTCPAIKISRYIPGADTLVEQAYAEFIHQELTKNDL
ncbi:MULTISPECIES: ATP-grasp domain-containing protein [Xenorhabdus]|uniref:ATP-grasp domain-containing protein n=1 Tax=Xenorhabdus TaxID=626 RepID=UPI00064A232B|nr:MULTISPECIES: ATP-grasp domain-containing protein [Xenorhabdus]KLU15825.1 hypothetical protein AAY47_08755 [Xenorhabdus griffiniae]KOP34707.1 hypothetical protein AFK69_03035 [Xenorhabdus sp. GDc328]